jgi:type IV pilus assembly protein PilM
MITEIFLPEKIGSTRIIAQRIVGLAIKEDVITAVITSAKSSTTVVEKVVEQKIIPGDSDTLVQRTADAIKELFSSLKKVDQIIVALPSSMVVFKEIQVPFKEIEKIRMVLDYEIESLLPFSLDEAIIDFIVTKELANGQGSQILVAAIRQHELSNILETYHMAGIDPTGISIDLFADYSIYQQIPEYFNIPGGNALIDVGNYITRIAFLQNGELKLTRTLQRGLMTIVESISNETKMKSEDVFSRLSLYGFKLTGDESYDNSLQNHGVNFFNDIQFTLNSFGIKLNYYEPITKILFSGRASTVKDIVDFSSKILQIPCELFDCQKIFDSKKLKNHTNGLVKDWGKFVVALGSALPSEQTAEFNLRRKSFVLPASKLLNKQLITAAVLLVCLFTAIGIKGYLQLNSIKSFEKKIEAQEINKLRKIIPPVKIPKMPVLTRLMSDAEKILKEKMDLWAPFQQQRLHPLELWLEVTKLINKNEYNISIESISIGSAHDDEAKDQTNVPAIVIEGYFKSKTGESNYANWGEFTKKLNESPLLTMSPKDVNESLTEGKGVKFSIKLKKREL